MSNLKGTKMLAHQLRGLGEFFEPYADEIDALRAEVEEAEADAREAHKRTDRTIADWNKAQAEIAALRAELTGVLHELQKMQPAGSPPPGNAVALAQWIVQAKCAEVEALRADAERYRWLRQERYMFREGAAVTCDTQAETAALWVKCPIYNDAKEVDEAIDTARAAGQPPEGQT